MLGSAGGRGEEGRLATHLALPPTHHHHHHHHHRCAIRRATAPTRRICTRTPRTRPWSGLSRARKHSARPTAAKQGAWRVGLGRASIPPALPCPQRDAHTRCRSHTAASEPSHGQDSLGREGAGQQGAHAGVSGGRDAGAVPAGGLRLWPAPVTHPATASLSHVVTGSRRRVTGPTSAPSNSIRRAGPAVHSIHTEHPAAALYGETWPAISPPGSRARIRPLAYPSCRSSHSGATTGPVAALVPGATAGPGVGVRGLAAAGPMQPAPRSAAAGCAQAQPVSASTPASRHEPAPQPKSTAPAPVPGGRTIAIAATSRCPGTRSDADMAVSKPDRA